MKPLAIATVALAALAAPAFAQDPNSSPSQRRNGYSGSSGTVSGGGTYLPGTGYSGSSYSTWGYGTGCRPGGIIGYPGFGTIWPGYGGYYGYGAGYGGYPGYYGTEGAYGGAPFGTATAAGPMQPAQPVVDRSPQSTASREIEEGRRRFRTGEYRSAVDSFRSAVVATTDNPVAQAWFAVGLIAAGDGKNADKALRSAAASGIPAGALSMDGMFRDDKERVRMIVALAKVGSEGGFAAAYLLSLAGEPVRLKQMAEKDPLARQLLPKP